LPLASLASSIDAIASLDHYKLSGALLMNTKLMLAAVALSLSLAACAKKAEEVPAEVPAAEAPAAEAPAAEAPAAEMPAGEAPAGEAATAAGEAAQEAEAPKQ
jgi:hypothetical protein